MKEKISARSKVCATCNAWLGDRELVDYKTYSCYDSSKGAECLNCASNRHGGDSCANWKQWSLLTHVYL